MAFEERLIVFVTSFASFTSSLMILTISFVELSVCSDSCLTSSATTANPLPASPALEA